MPAPEIGYYLDCSVELGNITSDVHFWGYNLEPNINNVIDGLTNRTDKYNHLKEKWSDHLSKECLVLESDYLDWYSGTSDKNRSVASFQGFREIPYMFKNIYDNMSHSVRWKTTLSKDDGDLSWMIASHLDRSTRHIPIVYEDDEIIIHDLNEQVRYYNTDVSIQRLNRCLNRWKHVKNQDYEKLYLDHHNVIQEVHESYQRLFDGNLNRKSEAKQLGRNKKKIRENRKILMKSVEFASPICGSENIKMFLRGKDITISGKEYDFVFVKNNDSPLVQSEPLYHGAITLKIFDKSGNFLHNLCIHTTDVPLLDHVASIALYVKAGLEKEVLEIGNPYKIVGRSYAVEKREECILAYTPRLIDTDKKVSNQRRKARCLEIRRKNSKLFLNIMAKYLDMDFLMDQYGKSQRFNNIVLPTLNDRNYNNIIANPRILEFEDNRIFVD